MIDPSIWVSEDISHLTCRQRLLLIGLISNSDDEGRGRAHPTYIRSVVFPYDDISLNDMSQDLEAIRNKVSILFYEIDGNKYYCFPKWKKWQKVDHPAPSLIPPPNENASETISESSVSDSLKIGENLTPNLKEDNRSEIKENEKKNNYVTACASFYIEALWSKKTSDYSNSEIDAIEIFIKEEDKKIVEEAFRIAAENKKYNVRYLRGIINNLKMEKIKREERKKKQEELSKPFVREIWAPEEMLMTKWKATYGNENKQVS